MPTPTPILALCKNWHSGGGGRCKQDTLVVGRARQRHSFSFVAATALCSKRKCDRYYRGFGSCRKGLCSRNHDWFGAMFLGAVFLESWLAEVEILAFIFLRGIRHVLTCEAPAVPRMRMWMAGRENGRYNRGLT